MIDKGMNIIMDKIFLLDVSLYHILIYFLIYGFIGWCMEVAYATVSSGKFINRGFLNGPICPIYAFGAVTVILALTPVEDNIILLFVGAVLLTTLWEYLVGYLLEKLFANKWWDYSDMPFNIRGYVCLKFSLMWGVACILLLKAVHPSIQAIVNLVPVFIGEIFIVFSFILIIADMTFTVKAVSKLNVRLKSITDLAQKVQANSDALKENIMQESLELKEKLEELTNKRKAMEKRILQAFPNLKSTKYFEALERIKEAYRERRR